MVPEHASPEQDILVAAAAGEPSSVRELLDLVGPTVYGFVFARVGGDESTAEDLVQETFLEGVRAARSFRGESALTTWFCTIARRRVARHYEAERRQTLAEHGLRLVGEEAVAAEDDDVADRDQVVQALGRLSPLHRQVLVLKYLDGRSVAEVADELGRSRVQVQSLLQRARDGLRAELEASGA